MSVAECRIIDLPIIHDQRGNLTFIEGRRHLPFDFPRVFYLYDVPGGSSRAGHALKECHQFLISISGSFDVVLDDGEEKARFQLNRPYYGLYIPPLIWRELENFSSNSMCLVLTSKRYDENDYYRRYDDFLAAVQKRDTPG